MTIIGGSRSLEPRVIGGGLASLQQGAGGFSTSFSNGRAGNTYQGISPLEGPRFSGGFSGSPAVIEGSRLDMIEGPRFDRRPVAPDLVTPDIFVRGGIGMGGSVQMPVQMPQQAVGGSVRMGQPIQAPRVLAQPIQQETFPPMQMQRPFVNAPMAMEEVLPRNPSFRGLQMMQAPSPSFPVADTFMPVSPQVYAARVLGGGIQSQEAPSFKQSVVPTQLLGGVPTTNIGGAQVMQMQGGAQIQYAAPTQIFEERTMVQALPTSVMNGETVVSSMVVNRPDMIAQGHIVRPQPGGMIAEVDTFPTIFPQEQPKCAILTIPDEYMAHISQNDFLEIQELCGSSIQYMQPDPDNGTMEWEVRVYGPDQARKESHEILEQRLNERLASQSSQIAPQAQEPPELHSSLMTMPEQCMQFFTQDDWRNVKELTACEVDVFEPDPALANDEWQVRFSGSQEGLELSNKMVDDILQERIAVQQQQEADNLARTLPMTQPGTTMGEGIVESIPPMETMGPGVDPMYTADPMYTNNMQPESQDSMQTVSMPTTVLPVPEEYLRMLTQEDLDNLMNQIGCAIKINDPEPGRDEFNFVIYGTKEQREECHGQIEDILTQRQTELMQMQGGEVDPMYGTMEANDAQYNVPMTGEYNVPMTGDDPNGLYAGGDNRYYEDQVPADNLVPCTVLPIPREYLDMLDNLEDICNATGCQMKATEGADENECQLSLFGTDQQREDAHAAIEFRINEVLGAMGNP